MIDNRYTLDTNILVYSVDKEAGAKHALAMQIIDKAIFVDCILTIQALAEFYNAVTRKGHAEHSQAYAFIETWTEIFPVVDNGGTILMRALNAVKDHKLSFWDAMLWSAAKDAGCSMILSEDFQDGRILGGVSFYNPFIPERINNFTLF